MGSFLHHYGQRIRVAHQKSKSLKKKKKKSDPLRKSQKTDNILLNLTVESKIGCWYLWQTPTDIEHNIQNNYH